MYRPNTVMLTVRGPMGVGRAAFAAPADAWAWVNNPRGAGGGSLSYVRPDGATILNSKLKNAQELLEWALPKKGA